MKNLDSEDAKIYDWIDILLHLKLVKANFYVEPKTISTAGSFRK